jgi:hypothetical protein
VRFITWTDDSDADDPDVSDREWYRRRWAPILGTIVTIFVVEPLWHHFL